MTIFGGLSCLTAKIMAASVHFKVILTATLLVAIFIALSQFVRTNLPQAE